MTKFNKMIQEYMDTIQDLETQISDIRSEGDPDELLPVYEQDLLDHKQILLQVAAGERQKALKSAWAMDTYPRGCIPDRVWSFINSEPY